MAWIVGSSSGNHAAPSSRPDAPRNERHAFHTAWRTPESRIRAARLGLCVDGYEYACTLMDGENGGSWHPPAPESGTRSMSHAPVLVLSQTTDTQLTLN